MELNTVLEIGIALFAAITVFVFIYFNKEKNILTERIFLKEKELEESKTNSTTLEQHNHSLRSEKEKLSIEFAQLETSLRKERESHAEKIALLSEAKKNLEDAFKALSVDALKQNNQSFIQLAQETLEKFQERAKGDLEKRQENINQIIKPVQESLQKFDLEVRKLENTRIGAYESLLQQVKILTDTHGELRNETSKLVDALKRPQVRGRWGEIQLRRVVEMAGMLEHCDFFEQSSVSTQDGSLRPDLVIRLPGQKQIVVDSKVALDGYLKAIEAKDEETRAKHLREHAVHVRTHVKQLSAKAYWEQFKPAPEFVVLFLPGEMFFSAALEQDPALIEQSIEQRVIIATPTTLIALLKAVAYGWRQENLEKNAEEISVLGKELYDRVITLSDHFIRLGKSIDNAVDAYNATVASLESRVLVSTRKFKELQIPAKEEIKTLSPVEKITRTPQLPDNRIE